MTDEQKKAAASGAKKVEEREEMTAGYGTPRGPSIEEVLPEDDLVKGRPRTALGRMELSMFERGAEVRVRVGDPHNVAEMWEGVFPSAEEANDALLDAGVLQQEQVGDGAKAVGTGLVLEGVTSEALEKAGLKRRGVSTL